MVKAAFLMFKGQILSWSCTLSSDLTVEAKGDCTGTIKCRICPTTPEINNS